MRVKGAPGLTRSMKPNQERTAAVARVVPREAVRATRRWRGWGDEVEEFLERREGAAEVFPVVGAGLDEAGSFCSCARPMAAWMSSGFKL